MITTDEVEATLLEIKIKGWDPEAFRPTLEAMAKEDTKERVWVEKEDIDFLMSTTIAYTGVHAATYRIGKDWTRVAYRSNPDETFAFPGTWSEVARAFLKLGLPEGQRTLLPLPAAIESDTHAPTYFAGRQEGWFALVDIKRCYSQLLAKLYGPALLWNRATGAEEVWNVKWPNTEVFDCKFMGHCIAGMLQSSEINFFSKGEPKKAPAKGLYFPNTVAFMHDVLHAIAQDAVNVFGCVRWFVDGGIVPLGRATDFQAYLSDRWGLESRVEVQGFGEVTDLLQYTLGETHKGGSLKPTEKGNPVDTIDPCADPDWMHGQLQRVVEREVPVVPVPYPERKAKALGKVHGPKQPARAKGKVYGPKQPAPLVSDIARAWSDGELDAAIATWYAYLEPHAFTELICKDSKDAMKAKTRLTRYARAHGFYVYCVVRENRCLAKSDQPLPHLAGAL